MYHGSTRTPGNEKDTLLKPPPSMSKLNYNYSVDKQILPTSSRSSLRSMEKLEHNGSNHLPAFEYEFKRKPYASFNNYSIIPPIKNKNSNIQESSNQVNEKEQRLEMLLEQEINSYTQKQEKILGNKNSFTTTNNVCT